MLWSRLQVVLRGITAILISTYALLLALFTLLRLLRLGGLPLLDLANTFAPYLYMPLVLSFPLSIIVARGGAEPVEAARKRLAIPGRKRDEDPGRRQRPRWPAALQIVLLAIGLYWFALPSIYRPLDPPAGETFRVISFNVQGSNAELERATEWLLGAEPDVIVLQETADGYDPRLAPLYAVYAHEDHIEGSARVFSRYAILQRDALTIETPGDDQSGREALRLLLNVDSRPWRSTPCISACRYDRGPRTLPTPISARRRCCATTRAAAMPRSAALCASWMTRARPTSPPAISI